MHYTQLSAEEIEDQYETGGFIDGTSPEYVRNGIWPRSRITWMIAIYLSLFIIRPWEILFPQLALIRFELLYFLLMIVAVLFAYKNKLLINSQTIATIFFILALGISVIFALSIELAWDEFYGKLPIFVFFFILILMIRNPYELIFLLLTYLVTMFIYLAKSQWEYFIHGAGRFDMGVHRLWGIENLYGYPNAVAQSVVLSFPILYAFWIKRKEISISWPPRWQKLFPVFLVSYTFLGLSSIVLTNSRMGMLATIFFVILVAFGGKSFVTKLRFVIIGFLSLIIVWNVIPEDTQNRFRTLWDPDAGPASAKISAEGRIYGFRAGIEMFVEYPLTGVGLGLFVPYRVRKVDGIAKSAHNLVGQLLGETGLIGAFTFFLLVGITLYYCRKLRILSTYSTSNQSRILSIFAVSFRNIIILLLFTGISSHNLFRFHWYWVAAFLSVAVFFMENELNSEESSYSSEQ